MFEGAESVLEQDQEDGRDAIDVSGVRQEPPFLRGKIGGPLWLVGLAAVLIATTMSGTASAAELCNPTPKVATSFCLDPNLTLSSTTPGDPLTIDLSGSDTSTNFSSDTNEWVQSLGLDLQSSGGSPVEITPSASMPDGLLIANSPSCGTVVDDSDCAAGHGTFAGIVSGTFGLEDGYHEGVFGIERIVNIQDAGSGNLAHYRVDFRYTLHLSSLPDLNGTYSLDVVVPDGGPGSGTVQMPTRHTFSQGISGCCTASVDGTLKNFALHLDGQSSTLEGGSPAGQTYKIFGVPSCGAWSASLLFTAGDLTRTLSFQRSLTLPACPIPPSSSTPAPAPTAAATATGQRAAALKKCKKKTGKPRKNCIKRAKKLPV